jgi:hypothetical protein
MPCRGCGRKPYDPRYISLDKIMRQKDPELLKAVQHLASGETVQGIALLAEQGRVTEIPNGQGRIAAPCVTSWMRRSIRFPMCQSLW